jgi:DNA helicase-2/ATP-dependent DNA helicase PcrA
MGSPAERFDFLDDEFLVSRLKNRGRLVVFGASGLLDGGAIHDEPLRQQLQNLRRQVPDLKAWFLFEDGEDPEATARKLRKLRAEHIEPEKPPRVIFVAPDRKQLLSISRDAFAPDAEIQSLLLVDHFLVFVADDIHVDLQATLRRPILSEEIPLSPIEEILADRMSEAGLEFETQVSIPPYCVDFLVKRNGQRLIVEADGRDFHNADQDAERDRIILERHNLKTLRFTGSQIVRACDRCVTEIFAEFDGFTTPAFELRDELELDEHQRKAVNHRAGHARVLAPAGSGKTKVLVSRVLRLMNMGVDPSGILTLAFNVKAAKELEDRLRALGVPLNRRSSSEAGVTVATLNAFSFRLLKEEGWSGEVLDTTKKETQIVKDALRNVGVHLGPMRGANPIVEVLEDMNRIKRGLLPPSEQVIEVEQRKGTLKIDADRVWSAMQELKSRRHKISFEDQIFLAADLMLRNADVRRRWQSRYDHILVDEFQDLNPAQSMLVRTMVAPSATLFAVGDDDQLIYSWRNAEVRGLLDGFIENYEGATTYALGTNYRCAKDIVRTGQRLIEHNKVRYQKTIEPAPDAPTGELELVAEDSLSDLGYQMASFIQRHMSSGVRASEIAVLARTKAQLPTAALALDKAGIPRTPLDGVRLYSTPVGQRLIAYLDTCLRAPLFVNAQRLPDVINRPNRFVSNPDVEIIRSSSDPWMAACFVAQDKTKGEMQKRSLRELLAKASDVGLALHQEHMPVSEKVSLIASSFAFAEKPEEKNRNREKATDDMLLQIMVEDAKSFGDIFAYLMHAREIAELEITGQPIPTQENEDQDRVALSTIHAAKGREWSTVCLFDASQPGGRKEISPNDVEEERRVLYVGMTRASRNLQVGFVKGRPVQFLAEAFLPEFSRAELNGGFESLLKALRSDSETLRLRAQQMRSAYDRDNLELDEEISGTRLRRDLEKLDLDEAALKADLSAARGSLEQANQQKIGGRLGQLLWGRVSPTEKSEVVTSALRLVEHVERRMDRLDGRRVQVRKASEQREIELRQEIERVSAEIAKVDAEISVIEERIADTIMAKPLFH